MQIYVLKKAIIKNSKQALINHFNLKRRTTNMKNTLRFLGLPIIIFCFTVGTTGVKAAPVVYADSTPASAISKKAETIVADYITAIGGMDAVKKLNSVLDSGTLTVQGNTLQVVQKKMVPGKMLQVVTMNGNTVGKTVFDGTKGYTEQMGNRTDMGETDMSDLKSQTSLIEQVDYLTNKAYKMAVIGTEKLNGADAYKLLVTMPSGKTDTEYYDVATKLLLQKTMANSVNGQDFTTTNKFSNYKKVGSVLLPYTLTAEISAGAMNQSFDILLTSIQVNEGVTAADFE